MSVHYFTSAEQLLRELEKSNGLTALERACMTVFRDMPEDEQGAIIKILRNFTEALPQCGIRSAWELLCKLSQRAAE